MSITYLVIALMAIFTVVMILGVSNPQLFARIVKSLVRATKQAVGLPVFTPEQEEAKAKVRRLAPYMGLLGRIEKLAPGQVLRFKIAKEKWCGDFVTVELNPEYPEKDRKYILSIESACHGRPDNERTPVYTSDEPMQIAISILDRSGELRTASEKVTVSA